MINMASIGVAMSIMIHGKEAEEDHPLTTSRYASIRPQ